MSDAHDHNRAEKPAHAAPPGEDPRRDFLKTIGIGGIGLGLAAVAGGPAVAYVAYPIFHATVEGSGAFVKVGKASSFNAGHPVKVDVLANEEIPGGARPRYVFGSVLMFLFMQQVVLGILLACYYSPSATDAWASVQYLNDQVTAGWFLRGLHHHGSSAMVVVTGLHFLQTVIAGAYRNPRELNWLTGLAMAGLVLGFALSAYLLTWDTKAVSGTQV